MGKSKQGKKRRREEREARRRAEELSNLGPDSPRPDQVMALIEYAGATPNDDGTVSVEAKRAWTVFPSMWFPGTASQAEIDAMGRLGTDVALAYFLNHDYQVAVYDAHGFGMRQPQGAWPAMWHLSIKRKDREPIDEQRWRILQRIKNELVGPENEAVELYPAESRLVDTANQYHLFVLKDSELRFPFGFNERLVAEVESHGSKQRAFDNKPPDLDDEDFAERFSNVMVDGEGS